jgi:battenin
LEIADMTGDQRFRLVLSLWPYMVPLFVVYAAEYALQAGTWSAMGFPLDEVEARDRFYEFSNWMYQAGVFVSRSSGTLFTAPIWLLWLMPGLQTCNLVLFCYVAGHADTSVLYSPAILYAGAFYTGLMGGAVYIHGYQRICADLPLAHREFALSATSVAEGLGIVVADALGLVIQACLYQTNGLEGAMLACPIGS